MTKPTRLNFTDRNQLYNWLMLHNKSARFKGLTRAQAAELFSEETGIAVTQNHVAGIVKDAELKIDWKKKPTIPAGTIKQLHDKIAHLEDRERILTEAHENLASGVSKLRELVLSLDHRCRDLSEKPHKTKMANAFHITSTPK